MRGEEGGVCSVRFDGAVERRCGLSLSVVWGGIDGDRGVPDVLWGLGPR